LRILVVASDPDASANLTSLLHRFGHRVEVASEWLAAWQAALREAPDVVLLDLAMSGIDAWEVARRLQAPAWEKKPFLIALAGCAGAADRRRSLEAGIDLHLVKPVNPDTLQRLLRRFEAIIGM
jgi:CheY-like chemotaxis protein